MRDSVCVGKGRILAGETDIKKIKEEDDHAFDQIEFDAINDWQDVIYTHNVRSLLVGPNKFKCACPVKPILLS